MLDPKQIGEFIAQLRRSKGLTQSALAEMLCVTHQAVSKWENGAALPDVEVLVAMRGVFGVSVDDILNAREPVVPQSAASGSGEGARADVVTEDAIVVYGSRWFDSKVEVNRCSVFGDAHFHSPVKFGSMEITGRATFIRAFTADTLAVSGEARIDGGTTVGAITVRGQLSVNGGVTCKTIENYGRTVFAGGVRCDSMRNAGSVRISGGITTTALFSVGEFDIGGGIHTTSLENSGRMRAGGGVDCDSFFSRKDCSLGAGLKARTARLSVRFRFGGGISADEILAWPSEDDCDAPEITARRLRVVGLGGKLSAKEIRAERGEMDHVHADRVAIKTGRIGEGCRIGRLECEPDVEIAPDAEVGEVVRLASS